MYKNIFTLLISTVLFLSVFTGCSNNPTKGTISSMSISEDSQDAVFDDNESGEWISGNNNSTNSQTNSASNTSKNQTSTSVSSDKQSADTTDSKDKTRFKGLTLQVGIAWDITNQTVRNEHVNVKGYYEGAQKFLKDYPGTKIEYLTGSAGGMWGDGQSLANAVASGKPWDVQYWASTISFPNAIIKNLYEPLDGLINYNNPFFPKNTNNAAIYKGKHYGACALEGEYWAYIYNRSWLEDLGMKLPSAYYDEGNWTYDTFRSFLQEFKTKSGKQGFRMNVGNPFDYVASSSNVSPVYLDANGKLVNNIKSNSVRNYLEFFRNIWYVDKTAKVDYQYLSYTSRNLGVISSSALMSFFPYMKKDPTKGMTDEFDFVPAPKESVSSQNKLYFNAFYFGIPRGAKNKEASSILINYLLEGGQKDFSTTINGMTSVQQKRFKDLMYNPVLPYGSYPGLTYPTVEQKIVLNGIPVQTYIDQAYNQINGAVNNFNK